MPKRAREEEQEQGDEMPKVAKKSKNAGKSKKTVGRIPRTVASGAQTVVNRTVLIATLTAGLAEVPFAYSVNANMIGDIASFQSVYDEYMIAKVTWIFVTGWESSGVSSGGSAVDCSGYATCFDFDDDNTPTSMAAVLSYDNAQLHDWQLGIRSRTMIPAVQTQIYQSAISTAYGSRKKCWITSNTITAPHYALKGCLQACAISLAAYPRLRIYAKMQLAFRHSR